MKWLALLMLAACATHASSSRFELEPPTSSAHYGPPRNAKPMALAPGQWVKRHVVDQDGHHELVTTKLIGLFGRQVWLENETEGQDGKRAIKLLLSLGDRKDAKTIDVFQYWIKHPDGRIEQLQPMLLGSLKAQLQRSLGEVLIAHRAQGQEDVAVAAGTFSRAYKARVQTASLGSRKESDTWWHSDVPFNGALRTVGVSAPGRSELVAFGLNGAKSAF